MKAYLVVGINVRGELQTELLKLNADCVEGDKMQFVGHILKGLGQGYIEFKRVPYIRRVCYIDKESLASQIFCVLAQSKGSGGVFVDKKQSYYDFD